MRFLIVVLSFWVTAATAQIYPQYQSTTVNDYADLLPPDQEAALVARLTELTTQTGVEMTILTLGSQAAFSSGQSLEAFATGLFNAWGIGDDIRNDGVLVLVLRTDRAMRIELGAGYGRDWDLAAKRVVEQDFLPAFREDNYAAGITTGVEAVIDKIVLPFRAGEASPVRAIDPDRLLQFVGAVVLGGHCGDHGECPAFSHDDPSPSQMSRVWAWRGEQNASGDSACVANDCRAGHKPVSLQFLRLFR